MKIIPINQTTFVLLQIVLNVIASPIMNANFDTMDATSAIVMLLISISIFAAVNYTVYARVLDANKSRNIAHFILIVNILSVFSNTLSSVSYLISIVFFFTFCFFEESLVIVIKYFDEEKAVKKIKKCKVFPKNEPVDFLIKIAESENKQKVLKVLMERKNRILS